MMDDDLKTQRRAIVIDCDPGLDDAAALMMAFGAPGHLDVQAVTTVAGNVGLAAVTRNASGLLQLCGKAAVPLHAGCPRALVGEGARAGHVHGDDGIGGFQLPPGPTVQPSHGVEALIRIARAAGPKGLTVVATGPLTNIACALTMAPDIMDHIDRIVLMGGAAWVPGNITPAAEFNFAVDPHGARITLECGLPITLMGLDVTRQAAVSEARVAAIAARGGASAHALAQMLRAYRACTDDPVLHDPCTIAWLLQPDLFAGVQGYASVETAAADTLGKLLFDPGADNDANAPVTVMTALDADGFYALLGDCVAALD
jgi:purine nucleosidase